MAGKWGALIVLAAAQFLMVLDQSVMNVSISQLVADFDTTVTTIQAVITLYSLVMAALMITGGKLGDILGRRRVFVIGLVVYGCGSALTAASWSVPTLALGWSVLEGIGAAMVMPAMVALVAGSYSGSDRDDRLRGAGRGRRRRDRRRPDPRRLGDDGAHLATGVRRRGAGRARDPARDPRSCASRRRASVRPGSTGSARSSPRSASG